MTKKIKKGVCVLDGGDVKLKFRPRPSYAINGRVEELIANILKCDLDYAYYVGCQMSHVRFSEISDYSLTLEVKKADAYLRKMYDLDSVQKAGSLVE